jgi:hypothetical protein
VTRLRAEYLRQESQEERCSKAEFGHTDKNCDKVYGQNHYYAFGLKIPALSSKSFEALPYAYQ